MTIKDIAFRYNMDEQALAARLKALKEGWTTPRGIKHVGYDDKVKEYNSLLDKKAYQELVNPIMSQTRKLKDTLENTHEHIREWLDQPEPQDETDLATPDIHNAAIRKTTKPAKPAPKAHLLVDHLQPAPLTLLAQLEADLDKLHQKASDWPGVNRNIKRNFPRKWLVGKLAQTFRELSTKDADKKRLTRFMTDVCTLWGIPTKGLNSTITELHAHGSK